MRKELIYLALLFVVLVSACTTRFNVTNCNSLKGAEKDICTAVNTHTFTSCKNIDDENKKKECIDKVIQAKLDPEPCADLKVTKDIDYCVNEMAKWTRNKKICQKISIPLTKDTCYLNLFGVYKGDSCNDIVGEGLKEICQKLANGEEIKDIQGVELKNLK